MQILARVQLEGCVHPILLEFVEQRPPAPGEFREPLFDQPRRPLRPGIDCVPEQSAGEGRMRLEAKPPALPRRKPHLLLRPFGPLGRLPLHLGRGEAVEQFVIGRVDRDQLALEVR